MENPQRFEIVKELHRSVWDDIRSWHRSVIECVAVLVTVTAVMGYALGHNEHVFLAIVVSQLAFIWILLVIIEAGHKYRVVQAISSNIEAEYACGLKGILPSPFSKPDYELPEIYKVHTIIFGIYFSFLPWVYVYWAKTVDCFVKLDIALILDVAGILLASVLLITYFYFMDKKKIKNKIFICVFAPFLIMAIVALVVCGLGKFLPGTIGVFGLWVIGGILLFVYRRSREKAFNKFHECTNLKERLITECPKGDDKKACPSPPPDAGQKSEAKS